jgi:hypothetical protein
METQSRQIQLKFNISIVICKQLLNFNINPRGTQENIARIQELELAFALETGHLFVDAASGEAQRIRASTAFSRVIAAGSYAATIDQMIIQTEKLILAARDKKQITNVVYADICRTIDGYPRGEYTRSAAGDVQLIDYTHCIACGANMIVNATRSELKCPEDDCGIICSLVGTVFDDLQFYSQEGQKAKSGTFNPNRHFRFWWTHILASEPESELAVRGETAEKLIDDVNEIIRRDKKILQLLTVVDVRLILQELVHTSNLNKNIPLILKKITGVSPPQLDDGIAVRVENIFSKAIEISERIRSDLRVNRNYYPYYIYKILDQLLDPTDFKQRRILCYIYMQSQDTVEADDREWEQVCMHLPEIDYVPTDRFGADKYRIR